MVSQVSANQLLVGRSNSTSNPFKASRKTIVQYYRNHQFPVFGVRDEDSCPSFECAGPNSDPLSDLQERVCHANEHSY